MSVLEETLRECVRETDGFAGVAKLNKDVFRLYDGPKFGGRIRPEMPTKDFRTVPPGENGCLTRPALGESRHAQCCRNWNDFSQRGSDSAATRMEYLSIAKLGKSWEVRREKWIELGVLPTDSNTVKKQKDDRHGYSESEFALLSIWIVTGPSFTSSSFISAPNTPVATRSSPKYRINDRTNLSYSRSAASAAAASE